MKSSKQSGSFARRRRVKAWAAWAGLIIGLAALFFALSRLSFMASMNIQSIEVYSSDQQIVPALQSAAYATIQGSYFGLFSKANIFLYPKKALITAVSGASPAVDSVEVKRDGLRGLTVSVSSKAPAAVVCADLPSFGDDGALSDDDSCYFADANGLVFAPAASSTPANFDRYYVPALPDDASAVGRHATSTDQFHALQSFIDSVKNAGIVAKALLIKDAGEYELYVDGPSAGDQVANVVVHFNDTAGMNTELEDFVLFWKNMVERAKSKGASLVWSDIKLQYPPNIYYTEIKPAPPTSSAAATKK